MICNFQLKSRKPVLDRHYGITLDTTTTTMQTTKQLPFTTINVNVFLNLNRFESQEDDTMMVMKDADASTQKHVETTTGNNGKRPKQITSSSNESEAESCTLGTSSSSSTSISYSDTDSSDTNETIAYHHQTTTALDNNCDNGNCSTEGLKTKAATATATATQDVAFSQGDNSNAETDHNNQPHASLQQPRRASFRDVFFHPADVDTTTLVNESNHSNDLVAFEDDNDVDNDELYSPDQQEKTRNVLLEMELSDGNSSQQYPPSGCLDNDPYFDDNKKEDKETLCCCFFAQ